MDELSEIKKLAGGSDKVIVSLPGSPVSYLGVGTIKKIRDTAYEGTMVDVQVAKSTGGVRGGLATSVTLFSIMKI
jgi:hypothetical protein